MCGFDRFRRDNHFAKESTRRTKADVQVETLKNERVAGKDEVIGEFIKVEVTWLWVGFGGYAIWPLKVVFCVKTGFLLWLLLCRSLMERTECKNYRGTSV